DVGRLPRESPQRLWNFRPFPVQRRTRSFVRFPAQRRTWRPPPMRLFARICAYAAVAVVLFVGLFSLLALRICNQSDLSLLLLESRRAAALRYRSEMVTHNIEIKRTIVADIVAGRLTLGEAAIHFQAANQMVENNDRDLLPDYQIPATEEGVYQQVL